MDGEPAGDGVRVGSLCRSALQRPKHEAGVGLANVEWREEN